MERILFISPSTQDRKTWILTLIPGILLVAFFGWGILYSFDRYHQVFLFPLFILFIIGWIATPCKYILTNTHLIIKRHWRDINIPLQEIRNIYLMPVPERRTLRHIFVYNGPFGLFGCFRAADNTWLSLYARRRNNWTVIVTGRKKYVIAPDDIQLVSLTAEQIGKADHNEQMSAAKGQSWYKLLPVIMIFAVCIPVYMSYKEPGVKMDSNTFIMKGMYGVNIPFTEISSADTIACNEIPAIAIRTNGISLFKTHRGRFRTTGGDKIRLSIYCGVDPVIRIVDNDGRMYFINRTNPNETRLIFKELNKNITSKQ
jgi:hypothetical protein